MAHAPPVPIATLALGFETLQRRLDNSVSRQLHLCLKLATKPVGFRADPDSKSGS